MACGEAFAGGTSTVSMPGLVVLCRLPLSARSGPVLLTSPLVFVRLALTSGSAQLEDSRIHLMKACLSAVLASFGEPSTVKDWDAGLASACSCLYMR